MDRWSRSLAALILLSGPGLARAQMSPSATGAAATPAPHTGGAASPTESPVPAAHPPATPDAKPAAGTETKPPSNVTDAEVLDATSLGEISGRSVRSPTGEDMGRIVDVLVAPSGQVRAAVVDFGGFLGVGSRKIAVDWKALNFADLDKSGNVIVALTRNQLRMAPEYKPGDPIVVLEATSPSAKAPVEAKAQPKPAATASAPPNDPHKN